MAGHARHRFQQQVAQSLGISVKSVFAMGGDLRHRIGGRGVVVAVVNGVSSGLSAYGIKVFPAAILGGSTRSAARCLRIIIGLLENIAQFVDSEYSWGNLYEIAPFYVLIIILMIKPTACPPKLCGVFMASPSSVGDFAPVWADRRRVDNQNDDQQ